MRYTNRRLLYFTLLYFSPVFFFHMCLLDLDRTNGNKWHRFLQARYLSCHPTMSNYRRNLTVLAQNSKNQPMASSCITRLLIGGTLFHLCHLSNARTKDQLNNVYINYSNYSNNNNNNSNNNLQQIIINL